MLKRQESLLSSSRRQGATTPPPSESRHAKAIGCMSGIFQFFSKYQDPNKRITFGRKQEKFMKPSSAAKSKISPPAAKEDKIEKQTFDETKRLTCGIKVQRSPTLPPDIRRPNAAAANTPENFRTPPSSLVARLMGLEDLSAAAKKATAAGEADLSVTENKRLLLLRALEKCNEDLEALKRIIKAVQTAADVRIQPPIPAASADKTAQPGGGSAVAEEANIPAVMAGKLTPSPPDRISIVQNSTPGATRVSQQLKLTAGRKPGENDEPTAKLLNKLTTAESSLRMRRQAAAAVTHSWCSQAMVKSVEEVCGDIAWGKKREFGRIGFVLQDHLCRELIEELVRELKSCTIHSLPFEACKRRLCF